MKKIIIIALGGFCGAALRTLLKMIFPSIWTTMAINWLGAFLLSFFVFYFVDKVRIHKHHALFVSTGLLGSFTTFSTFSLDVLKVFSNGQLALGFAQIAGQVIFGISFCYFGVKMGERFI